MALNIEKRALNHSETHDIELLGPEPMALVSEEHSSDGVYRVFGARSGMTISLFDFIAGDTPQKEMHAKPCIALNMLFDASAVGWLMDTDGTRCGPVPLRSGRFYCMVAPDGISGYDDVVIGSRFRGLDIRIEPNLWRRLSGDRIQGCLTEDHPYCSTISGTAWVGILPVSPEFMVLTKQLYDAAVSGAEDLIVETRSLEIIEKTIHQIQLNKDIKHPYAKDKKTIKYVQNIIANDLAYPWTVTELAQAAGVTLKKLKSIFPIHVDMPVYAYLQEMRLKAAHEMVSEQKHSITEISMTVGYTSLSHFSALFRRRFGMSPSSLSKFSQDQER